jgi:hypothetical protein
MKKKILKFSLITLAVVGMVACGHKTLSAFKDISMVEAIPDKTGFLPFQMFFSKNENPYVQYENLNEKIEINYSRKEKDESDNSIIYFFTDEWNGEYQIRINDEGNLVRMRFVSKKLNRNVPYLVAKINYQDGTIIYKNVEKLYVEGQKSDIVKQETELLQLLKNKKYLDFKKQFMNLIISNDTTIDYPFRRLITYERTRVENNDVGYCYSQFNLITSDDRNVRFYALPSNECIEGEIEDEYDAATDFYQFVQFRDNPYNIYTQIIFGRQNAKDYESIFTVNIGGTTYYIVTYEWWYWDGQCKYIKAYTIDESQLVPAKIFKLKNSTLSSTLTSVATCDGGMKISYDKKEKILSIEDWRNGIEYYQLKDNLFQYIKNLSVKGADVKQK